MAGSRFIRTLVLPRPRRLWITWPVMRPRRWAVLLLAGLLFGACDGTAPTPQAQPAATTTTSTTAATTTTTPPVARVRPLRASRAASAPRVAVAPQIWSHIEGIPPIMLRIRWCESRNNYTAQNRHSSASGAWQFLDSSWAKYAGYERAYLAPPAVQDQKAMNVYNAVGTRPWRASAHCWS